MPFFDSDGAAIHYLEAGEGTPVVLIHSMASNLRHSWVDTGWMEHLRPSHRVIALDCRGHGLSAKSYDDPDFYTADRMVTRHNSRASSPHRFDLAVVHSRPPPRNSIEQLCREEPQP